ncbi:MAG: CopG family antitoxin [Actinomycetota bacterium]|nr:CopG family antitoxin [Actinomycetota bacterium]
MKYELDTDEKIIEKEAAEYKKVSGEKKKNIESVLEKSSKKRVVTLRLNNNDLEQLKSIANTEGIPYQTLISSIIHKYINDRFVDKKEVFKISELLK